MAQVNRFSHGTRDVSLAKNKTEGGTLFVMDSVSEIRLLILKNGGCE